MHIRVLLVVLTFVWAAQVARADDTDHYQRDLAHSEATMATRSSPHDWLYLGRAAQAALETGDRRKAENYAHETLRRLSTGAPWLVKIYGGEDIYYAHWVLGRLAFNDGNFDLARQELLAAGKSQGSPVLKSFGPNMKLAFELLTRPDSDEDDWKAVQRFLEECSTFWHRPELRQWQIDVSRGNIPFFGFNLSG